VKWFGGFNNSTRRENHYGFIQAGGIDFFVHRSAVLSRPDTMIEGAKVLFHRLEDRDGRPAATAVRALSEISNDELVASERDAESIARSRAYDCFDEKGSDTIP
jgi:cold shock CspA family protein